MSTRDLLTGIHAATKAADHLFEEQQREGSKAAAFDAVLRFLNRGTSASASAFDEMLFDPTPEPVSAFIDGLRGRGQVQNFGELSKKAGWNPNTKEGKAAQFLLSTGLDVGLAPDTYLTFGAAPAAKLLGPAAKLVKGGLTSAEIAGQFGKGTARAAKIIEKAEKFKDPRVDEVVSKLLKGEPITRAEEAILGARTTFGLQAPFSSKVFGVEGLIPQAREGNVRFFTDMEKVSKWLNEAPVISPALHGVHKAFNAFSEIRRKASEYFKLRKGRDQKVNYGTAQGFQRAIYSISKLANADEREVITKLLELPDENILAKSYFKDITKWIDEEPQMYLDLGFKPGEVLNEEDSVALVDHWLNRFNQWVSEFGEEGIFRQRELREQSDLLQAGIRRENDAATAARDMLESLQGRPRDEVVSTTPSGGRPTENTVAELRKQLRSQIAGHNKNIAEYEKVLQRVDDTLFRRLGPVTEAVEQFDLGRGHFGEVKGRWDTVKFQDHVIKLPVALDVESFQSLVGEAKAYKALQGIPGVGKARMVFKEIPLDAQTDNLDLLFREGGGQFSSVGLTQLEELAEAGFVITKSNGDRVLKVPHVVKKLVDIDKEATAAFHSTGGNPKWRIPTKAIRSFEKLLTLASRQGVSLSDLLEGNLVVDKKGNVHLLDLGYGLKVDKTPEGLQAAWRRNLVRFAHHVINNTRFTTKESQSAIRKLVDDYVTPTGGKGPIIEDISDENVRLLQLALKRAGMPVRFLTEKASTQPLVEGFTSITPDGLRKNRQVPEAFKIKQRKLVEERDELLSSLSPKAREAYENVQLWKREMTERLLAHDLLTEEWIDAFETKFGLPHLRHLRTQEGLVQRFQQAVKGALKNKAGTLKARKMEGSIKDITDRLGREFFETDIAKIMFASEVEVTSAIENWKLLQKVADNNEWTRPALEVARRIPIKKGKRKGGFRTVKEFRAEEGYDLIKHPAFEGKMVRQEIADDINKMVGKSREDLGAQIIKKWYDPVHNWMRAYTLFLFPSYHIRNFAGAIWNNFLADVDPLDHVRAHRILFGTKPVKQWADEFAQGRPFEVDGIRAPRPDKKLPFKVDGKTMTHQQLLDEANEMGVMGRGQMGPHGEIERGLVGELGNIFPDRTVRGALSQVGTDNTFVQFGARVGTQVENVVRLAHYMNKRKFGLSAMDASMSVKKFQFDYSELSDFERNWLKRIFFFYTWTRKNVPLQVKQFLMRPGRFTGALKTKEEIETLFGGPEPEEKLVPEWLNKQFGVRFRFNEKSKTYEYFLLGSWLPAADIHRIFNPGEELLDMVSPIPKTIIERATNTSTFFDEPIEEFPGERKEFISPEAGQLLANVPGADALARLLFDAPIEEGVTVRGKTHHLLRQLRIVNEARRVSEAAVRGGPELAILNTLIGKSYEFDPQRARRGQDFEIKMQIAKLKGDVKRAQRRGKPSEVRRLMAEIRELQKGLTR